MRSRLSVPRRAAASFPHLPPGREPGAQTLRNRSRAPLVEAFCGLVGLAMFVSGVLLAAGIRGPKFDRSEEFWGGAFFAAIGLLCAAWGYAAIRARWPLGRRLRGATLAVDRDEARRGELVSVTLTLATSPGRDGEELEVGIVCTERWDYQVQARPRGAPVVLRQTAEATPHQEWRAVEHRRGEHVVTFEIPHDAPYSYEGECVSFAWRVSARLVRRLRSDPRLDHPVWVRA